MLKIFLAMGKNKTKQNIKSQHAIKEDFTKWKYALLLGGEANTVKAQFSLNQCAGSIWAQENSQQDVY